MAALTQPNDFALAILCRYLGVHERTYLSLVKLRIFKNISKETDVAEMVSNYRSIDKNSADRALRFHLIRAKMP